MATAAMRGRSFKTYKTVRKEIFLENTLTLQPFTFYTIKKIFTKVIKNFKHWLELKRVGLKLIKLYNVLRNFVVMCDVNIVS
jgi:hypothetical protein